VRAIGSQRGAVMKEAMVDEVMSDAGTQLLTPEEAARRLSIGRSFMFSLLHTGAIRSVKIGRARRVRVHDLDEYVRTLLDEQCY
jgi:excisionase family DNA binding protein